MPRSTENTLTTQRSYLAALDDVRRTGYAVDDGENEGGARCVAAAIPDAKLPLAISVAGPDARLTVTLVPKIAKRLVAATSALASGLRPAHPEDRPVTLKAAPPG